MFEAEFLIALQHGDEHAWEQFFERVLKPLKERLAYRFDNLSPSEIDDVWSAAIAKIFARIGTVRTPETLTGWAWTVARNAAVDVLRQQDLSTPLETESIVDDVDAVGDVEVRVDAVDVLDHLQTLLEDTLERSHSTVLLSKAVDNQPDALIYTLTQLLPPQQRGVLGYVARTKR